MDIGRYIGESPFFKGLSEQHYQELARVSRLKRVKKREYLFHEGEHGVSMFMLVDGHIQLHKNNEDGREVVIRMVKPGEVFAEVVLFERDRYPVSARAVTQAELLLFPRKGIQRLLSQEHFRNGFISLLMNKQRYLTERIQELTTRDIEYRLFTFLRSQYGERSTIHIPISKKDVAAAIGTTPESLSRLIQRLQEERVMEWKGRDIRFLSNPWKWIS